MLEGYRLTTEDEKYHYCKEQIPDIAGTYSGTLVIYGGGRDMWQDNDAAMKLLEGQKFHRLAVNIAGMVLPDIEHLFSLHFKQIAAIAAFRKSEYSDRFITHSGKPWEGVDYNWYLALGASTSGFIAVVLGYILGYRKMILCGVPMDGSGYFYKPMINPTFGDKHRAEEIVRLKDKYGLWVRSMSGRSSEILGKPDLQWLKESVYASSI